MYDIPSNWNELETHIQELVAAAQALNKSRTVGLNARIEPSSAFSHSPKTASEIQLARQRVTAVLGQLQNLVTEPGDFIQRLAHHVSSMCFLVSRQHNSNQS